MAKYARSKANNGAPYTIGYSVPLIGNDTTWYLKPDNRGQDYRKVGNKPIQKESDTLPEDFVYDDDREYWELKFKEVKKNAGPYKGVIPFTWDRIKEIFGFKNGGEFKWINSFAAGGKMSQMMQKLLSIVKKAAKEILSGKPGQAVQQLAQIAQDLQGAQLLDQLSKENPQIGLITQAAIEMIQTGEKGIELENKFAKGGCPCKTHKKLMKIGGKLIELLVDCEGRIVFSKKGSKVKKAYTGEELLAKGAISKQEAEKNGGLNYATMGTDGNMQYWERTKSSDGLNVSNYSDWKQVIPDDQTKFNYAPYMHKNYDYTTGLYPGQSARISDQYGNVRLISSLADKDILNAKNNYALSNGDVILDENVTSTARGIDLIRLKRALRRAAMALNKANGVKDYNPYTQWKIDQNRLYGTYSKNKGVIKALGKNVVTGKGMIAATRDRRRAIKSNQKQNALNQTSETIQLTDVQNSQSAPTLTNISKVTPKSTGYRINLKLGGWLYKQF